MRKAILKLIAIVLAIFGFITLFMSSSVIFDLFGIRAKEGNYVLFVVWANFLSSLLYLFAAYAFIKVKKWTTHLLAFSEMLLIAAFIGLIIHISAGGIYESKTISAMIFRIIITLSFLIASYFTITYFERISHKHANKGKSKLNNKSL